MLRSFRQAAVAAPIFTVAILLAQLQPSLFAAAPSPGKPAATPAPSATPTTGQVIDSLSSADIQAAITLLKNNYTNPGAMTDIELNRALLEGLLIRQSRGLKLLPGPARALAKEPGFYVEVFDGDVGYLRPGALDKTSLKTMDRKLAEFSSKKINGLILDLRDSSGTSDFESAAEFANRFCPNGKPLFTLHKPGPHKDRNFTSDRDPAYRGLMVILTDGDTAGGAEAVAAVLRLYDKALIVGEPTAGCAVEYSDLALPSGKVLQVATGEAVLADGKSLFPGGVKPDLPVEMSLAEKREIFQLSATEGMEPFVYETERPHMNEAALLAGTNPEVDATEAQSHAPRHAKRQMRDLVLQRALDLVTSLEVYQKK
jgi:Peptidase family S41